jgi:hypothetical protein
MAVIAIQHRAQLATAAVLLMIAVAPWRTPERATYEPMTIAVWDLGPTLGMTPVPGPLAIDTPWMDPVLMPNGFHSWAHPDLRPWPTGMVIQPLTSGDRNLLERLGLWDRLLSALLGPFRSASA